MELILLHERWVINAARRRDHPRYFVLLRPRDFEVVRIPNPYGYPGNWLVIIGTKIGAPESWWRQWVTGTAVRPLNFEPELQVFIRE